jgi:phosphomevalonate kinase
MPSAQSFRLSAPGKLFLTGEYAVLWGAPATIAAVTPRLGATLQFESNSAADELVRLDVPGAQLVGRWSGEHLAWNEAPPAAARFAASALTLALERNRKRARGMSLRFETSARGHSGQKLGLGTSASAAAIASLAGLLSANSDEPPAKAEVFAVAARAHWESQNRKGSNGDVAAACFGSVTLYRRYPVETEPLSLEPDVRSVTTHSLKLALISSGQAAKTPSMVAAVERALSSEERASFAARSSEVTLAFAGALERSRFAEALQALNRAGDLLEELGARAGVSVVTPTLATLTSLGRDAGLAAKVSGAGGGDSVLFAGFDAGALSAAVEAARARGHFAIELSLSEGVRAEAK